MQDKINHPGHYTWLKEAAGIEVIDITRHMSFNLGNVCKYVLRAGHKHEEGMSDDAKSIEDLKKARWYLDDEIARLERQADKEEAVPPSHMDVTRIVEERHTSSVTNMVANLVASSSRCTSKAEKAEAAGTIGAPDTTAPHETKPGYDFADLGLSVKWAAKNVRPHGSTLSSRYSEYESYETCTRARSGDGRIPTWEEFRELIANCSYRWAEQDGVWGGRFTSKRNGNSVFFPADGYYPGRGYEPKKVGMRGYYWSVTLDKYDRRKACCLLVMNGGRRLRRLVKNKWHLPIRLVQDYEKD